MRKYKGLFIALALTFSFGAGQVFDTIALADQKPGEPMNLTGVMHDNNLQITWDPVTTATIYELDGRVVGGGTWASQYQGNERIFEDTRPPSDKELEFRVRARNENGWGAWSESVVVRTPPIFKDIYFDFEEFVITPRSTRALNRIAKWMTENPNYQILIGGYAEEREGTPNDKIILGERRARAAREYLVNQGVSLSRINVISYGEEGAVCTESNETCWRKNRRTNFVVTNQ
ncbi:OmpA family protein [Desulfobacterota bacterium AH_259_B03_O07]|nr:OmpA family protein [Desulfobacterota bacterium AH_259_B03_O07]